jgi:DNA polymerase-3 subunit delta
VAQPAKRASDAAGILREAAENRAPVYLFAGEPFQTETLARRVIDVLVPADKRSVMLEVYDGRSIPLPQILDSCRTVGLFGGGKVVWVREPAFFAAGDKKGDIADAMFAAWGADRGKQAAEKLLALAALAGWGQEDLAGGSFASLTKTKLKAFLGREIGDSDARVLDAVAALALESGMSVASHKDESTLLEEFLASGGGGDTVLLLTAAAVDRRKRIFKEIEKRGVCAELSVERERSGALTREAVEAMIDGVLTQWGMRPSPAARRAIAERAGGDPAQLHSELEKVCLHAGDGPSIEEADVAAVMRDLGESWVFDFTGALAQRNIGKALALLRRLFAQGEPALRLLAMISREIRILLAAREILSTSLARSWSPGMQFNRFRDQLLPQIPDDQKQLVGGMHPYVLYLALQNASRANAADLERALVELHEIDVALKSSRTDPQIRLEAFVLGLARQ